MRLSDAIRLGAMLKPQTTLGAMDTGTATCALGAAYEAQPPDATYRLVTGPLDIYGGTAFRGMAAPAMGSVCTVLRASQEWGSVLWREFPCPECGERRDVGSRLIPHLNDDHKWTREQIADWVAEQEPQTPQDTPVHAEV